MRSYDPELMSRVKREVIDVFTRHELDLAERLISLSEVSAEILETGVQRRDIRDRLITQVAASTRTWLGQGVRDRAH